MTLNIPALLFEQSQAIFLEIGNRNREAASLVNLGNAYQSLGRYQGAIEFFQLSLDIAREIGAAEGTQSARNGEAEGAGEAGGAEGASTLSNHRSR